jgi:hypothetical protein
MQASSNTQLSKSEDAELDMKRPYTPPEVKLLDEAIEQGAGGFDDGEANQTSAS